MLSVILHTVVLSLSLTAAIVYGINARATPTYQRMIAKTLAVALLAILAALSGGPTLLAAALAFGSAGDAFLAWDGDVAFLGGLANFLVSHLLYIVLFVQKGQGKELALSGGFRALIAVSMVLLAPTMVVLLMPRVDRFLRFPVFIYSTAILSMVLTSLTMDNIRIIVGGALFAMSDTILAGGKFLVPDSSPHRAWMDYVVWILYYSGQLLIALGALNTSDDLLANI